LSDLGLSILLIEHDMSWSWGLRLHHGARFGQVIAEGPPSEIQRDEAVIEAYLGRGGLMLQVRD